jgi:hypothetical protein
MAVLTDLLADCMTDWLAAGDPGGAWRRMRRRDVPRRPGALHHSDRGGRGRRGLSPKGGPDQHAARGSGAVEGRQEACRAQLVEMSVLPVLLQSAKLTSS